jgi:glycosyltransferase involved in cell wall biosynthesis
MKRNLWYFELEPLKARYTYQLSQQWAPATFEQFSDQLEFRPIKGNFDPTEQIKVGVVFDAVGRGKFAMSQVSAFLDLIAVGEVKTGDVIYLADFYTPGVDAIFYALDLYGIKCKWYSRVWAQSVDEYDFTWQMQSWMRKTELAIDSQMAGIFVGSTIHKDQLRQAGFTAHIHVLSLPLHLSLTEDVLHLYDEVSPQKTVVYTSRFDKEKNPFFMLEVAEEFLKRNPDWKWAVTTSASTVRSNLPGVVDAIYSLAERQPRFTVLSNLTKEEYYRFVKNSTILFNSSLQDYVSWTALEANVMGTDFVFPNFRSFPEFMPEDRMYKPFDKESAVSLLARVATNPRRDYNFAEVSDLGRQMEGYVIANESETEFNIWFEKEYCKQLLNK